MPFPERVQNIFSPSFTFVVVIFVVIRSPSLIVSSLFVVIEYVFSGALVASLIVMEAVSMKNCCVRAESE